MALISAIVFLLLLLLALFFRSGAGGGARGQRGRGVNKGSGAAAGTEPKGTLPYDAGKGNQSSGEPPKGATPSGSDAPSRAILFERTSLFDGIQGGAGSIGGGGTSFFGLSAAGGSFVYVVDCSGSMAGEGLKIAKESLFFSISQLDEEQEFYVFFYDSSSHPMPGGRMVKATSENKDTYRQWIETIKGGGGTMPEESLLAAIAMQPEVIFFMSDGEFNVGVCDQIKVAQGDNPITIHAIGFVNRSGEPVLKRLASDSGGMYSFVPRGAKKP